VIAEEVIPRIVGAIRGIGRDCEVKSKTLNPEISSEITNWVAEDLAKDAGKRKGCEKDEQP
jgi:hypothetical protein